jgi:predicted dehydrogenase
VVSVTCRSAPWRCTEAPLRSDGQIALYQTAKGALIKIMVTLNTRRPAEHRYRLFGTEGSAEWFSYEGYCRLFPRGREEREGWQRVDIGSAARDDDKAGGHGGTDIKLARCFIDTLLAGKRAPIDVYRLIEYTLPGILAAKSADLGGMPLEVPDLRRTPFEATTFWETVGLPEVDPSRDP